MLQCVVFAELRLLTEPARCVILIEGNNILDSPCASCIFEVMKAKKQETDFPQTLHAAIKYFANEDRALDFMKAIRWPNGKYE